MADRVTKEHAAGIEQLNRMRAENGELPSFAWPGGYVVIYMTADNSVLCAECANAADDSDPVVSHGPFHEGPPMECDGCGRMIESDYGDPDEESANN